MVGARPHLQVADVQPRFRSYLTEQIHQPKPHPAALEVEAVRGPFFLQERREIGLLPPVEAFVKKRHVPSFSVCRSRDAD